MTWEIVLDEPHQRVRRLAVPGGWLYQVESLREFFSGEDGKEPTYSTGWHSPVFVATS